VRMVRFEMDGPVFVLHARETHMENTGYKCVAFVHSFSRQNCLKCANNI
jgi:hypothetical protein